MKAIWENQDCFCEYKLACSVFEEALYRKSERKFHYDKAKELETCYTCTSNPREFWQYIQKLGPSKKNLFL